MTPQFCPGHVFVVVLSLQMLFLSDKRFERLLWVFKLESKCGWVTGENTHDIVRDYNYANNKNAIALKNIYIKNKIKVLRFCKNSSNSSSWTILLFAEFPTATLLDWANHTLVQNLVYGTWWPRQNAAVRTDFDRKLEGFCKWFK